MTSDTAPDELATDAEEMAATPAPPVQPVAGGDTSRGFLYALAAYLIWGTLPFYMKAVAHIPTVEVLAHRVLWSVPIALVLLVLMGRTGDIRKALRSPKTLAQSGVAAAFVSVNWGVYVWAIGAGRAIETALGYYINPLLTVLVGAVLLGERLARAQMVAIALAAVAVAVLTWESGGLPWVSLALAGSWAMYAFFKKTLPIGPAQGFFLEVLLLTPLALGYVIWLQASGVGHFGSTGAADLWLLLGCGAVTAVPLILYANGAKGLTLSTIGIMQYIAPTMVFLIAVFAFGEAFSWYKAVAFVLIWSGLAIYTTSMLRGRAASSPRATSSR